MITAILSKAGNGEDVKLRVCNEIPGRAGYDDRIQAGYDDKIQTGYDGKRIYHLGLNLSSKTAFWEDGTALGMHLSSKQAFPEDKPGMKTLPSSKSHLPEDKPGMKTLPSSKSHLPEDKPKDLHSGRQGMDREAVGG